MFVNNLHLKKKITDLHVMKLTLALVLLIWIYTDNSRNKLWLTKTFPIQKQQNIMLLFRKLFYNVLVCLAIIT